MVIQPVPWIIMMVIQIIVITMLHSQVRTVSSLLTNDVLILEVWFPNTEGDSDPFSFRYDGTTVNTTDNAAVTNPASFLETPENLTFAGGPGGPITMTESAAKTYSNKFITKV